MVDDGSLDDQCDVVSSKFGDSVTLLQKHNGGVSSARNCGLDHATGELIAFLDADDYWESTRLEEQIAILERHPQVGLVAAEWYKQDPHSGARSHRRDASLARITDTVLSVSGRDAFMIATKIWTGVVLVKRSVLGQERFRHDLPTAEDRDFWFRLLMRAPAYICSKPLATAVLVPNSLSRGNIDRDYASMLKLVDLHKPNLGATGWRYWRSHTYYCWAAVETSPLKGLVRLVYSLLLWPLPLVALGPNRFGRVKRAVVLCVKAMRFLG